VKPERFERSARLRVALLLMALALLAIAGGTAIGSTGLGWPGGDPLAPIVSAIRLPRSVGAWLAGALLGLSGALAQGLFRNPLAEPYLLGTGSGAVLGVALTLLAGANELEFVGRLGVVGAAFAGGFVAVSMTVLFAGGGGRGLHLLLAGIVVAMVLGAVAQLVMLFVPEALRTMQSFMLGTTGLIGWPACALLAAALAVCLPPALRLGRALDALGLGEDTAASLGLSLGRLRLILVALLALSCGAAVAQVGLVAFVGLVAPHLLRRVAPGSQAWMLGGSALSGGLLLLLSDLGARGLFAPRELPVGVVTAVLGGGYLLWRMHRGRW